MLSYEPFKEGEYKMKRITNRSEFDELIEKISKCLEYFERNKFNDKVYNLLLDNGERLKIVFDNNNLAHLLGIDTEYLKTTGLFKGKSYEILKQICNDSYRLYTMIKEGHIVFENFISDFAWKKVESFEKICGINLNDMEFVCQYKRENSYITGSEHLEGDYYIAYKSDNGLIIVGFKKNDEFYYPMTNRVIDYEMGENKSFLNKLLAKQSITMATYANYNYRNMEGLTTSNRNNIYLDYNRKSLVIRNLLELGEEYNCNVDVSVGYSFVIDKLLSKFDSNKKIYLAFQIAFEYILKHSKINIRKVKNHCGDLPDEIISLMEEYNKTIGGKTIDFDDEPDEKTSKDIAELEMLKKQLLEQTSRIQELEQLNAQYQKRETEIKRILSI